MEEKIPAAAAPISLSEVSTAPAPSSSWRKVKAEGEVRQKIRALSRFNSKYEAIKQAKARYSSIRQDQTKLDQDDYDDTFRDVERSVQDPNELDKLHKARDDASQGSSRSSHVFRRNSFEARRRMSHGGEEVDHAPDPLSDDVVPPDFDFQDIVDGFMGRALVEAPVSPRFDDGSTLLVKKVPAEEVARRLKEKEDGRLNQLKKAADDYARREVELAQREQSARLRVVAASRKAEEERLKQRCDDMSVHIARERGIRRHFSRARDRLFRVLQQQQGYIRETFGSISTSSSVAARRYRVNWELLPKPVEVRIHMVRAVKDRLPRGRYVFLLSMQNRLSGRPLRWSKIHSYAGTAGFKTPHSSTSFPAMTTPFKHKGRFHDLKLRVAQSVFALCPARGDLQPGNVFILELFKLAEKNNDARPTVVGWTAFPMSSSPNFGVVKGKLKLPLLRGQVDRSFEKFSQIEKVVGDSLSNWLGNAYVEIRHLPRETIDDRGILRNEHQVECDFINKLLRLDEEGATGKVHPLPAETAHSWWRRRRTIFNRRGSIARDKEIGRHTSRGPAPAESMRPIQEENSPRVHGNEPDSDDVEMEEGEKKPLADGANYDNRGLDVARTSIVIRKDGETRLEKNWWSDLSDSHALEEFSPSVASTVDTGHRKHLGTSRIAKAKIRFLTQEICQDLGYDELSTYRGASVFRRCFRMVCHGDNERWLRTYVAIFAVWLRMYVHYVGQYLLLTSVMRVAVYGFQPRLYTLEFKYAPSSTTALGDVAVVAFGPGSVLLIFIIWASAGRLWRCFASDLPEVFSQFVAAFGLAAIFDPLLIFAVDLATRNYSCDTRPGCRNDYTDKSCHCVEGDAFKLWRRMTDDENGGIVGIFYVVVLYFITTSAAVAANAYYLINVHANGRILDTYHRIFNGDDYFVPDDLEVSLHELEHVLAKARRWVGPQDQRRIVKIDHVEVDPSVGRTTIISIAQVQTDGTSWIYRKFVRNPNGVIMELFGSDITTTAYIDQEGLKVPLLRKETVDEGSADLGRLDGTQATSNFFENIPSVVSPPA